MKVKEYPPLLLALMGSLDCLTTVIGVVYFGAVELNPLIVGVVSNSLPAFVILKLTATVFVCFIFMQTEKILVKTRNRSAQTFYWMNGIFKITYAGIIMFLFVVVANNIIVLASAI